MTKIADIKKSPIVIRQAINLVDYANGALGEIRTPDPLVRSQVLYPTELQARILHFIHCEDNIFCSKLGWSLYR